MRADRWLGGQRGAEADEGGRLLHEEGGGGGVSCMHEEGEGCVCVLHASQHALTRPLYPTTNKRPLPPKIIRKIMPPTNVTPLYAVLNSAVYWTRGGGGAVALQASTLFGVCRRMEA